MKKTSLLFTAMIALAVTAIALTSSHGQDPDWKPPGSDEQAAVDAANGTIDKVYSELMSKLDDKQQKSLKDTQRAWIKWRDAEAEFVARLGGAIGGSALRVDFANAQLKLIQERTNVLRGYIQEAENQQSNGD
jgi:uncharacterized protein YecT (DUF1311 family)